MFFKRFCKNHHIIKVDKEILTDHVFKDLVHHPLECSRRITWSERHPIVFPKTIWSTESRPFASSGSHSKLMITGIEIQGRNVDSFVCHVIKDVVNEGYWLSVLLCFFVNPSVVNTKSCSELPGVHSFLSDHYNGR